MSVFERFKGLDSNAQAFTMEGFWRHSIGVSCVAKQLSMVLGRAEPEDAFVAGLLHDVGKLVMLQHFPDDVDDLTRAAEEQQLTWASCEDVLFPINHSRIGRALFRAWDFPPPVVEAVACHHKPETASRHAELAAIVHLADYFSYHLDAGCPGAVAPRLHSQDAAQLVGLTPDTASQVVEQARGDMNESLEMLKLLD